MFKAVYRIREVAQPERPELRQDRELIDSRSCIVNCRGV